ncbi:MAG: hypothetical protein LC785_03505, partial [Acidobacteria bacterium]|nr:hypothetical protein [Acidobacteriota bacterium]
MGGKGRDFGQKLVAILVIFAMLALLGLPIPVIIFFAVVVFFVWRAVDRSEQHETRLTFEFYLSAHEILREDDRRWFGFEINEVIAAGESVLHSMKNAPPLVHYALGALYHRAADYAAAVEHLAYVVEDEEADEGSFTTPTPELRRYAEVLRRLEREPADGPLTIAAVRSLQRARSTRAAALLEESRSHLSASRAPQLVQSATDEADAAPARLNRGAPKPPHTKDQAQAHP